MKMTLSKEFEFDSAHNLIDYHGKCENLHGHTYQLRVTLLGTPSEESGKSGMILDFGILKSVVKEKVISKLDHAYLNDIVPQSTAENLSLWIWQQLEEELHGENYELYEIKLWETKTSFVTLQKDN